MGEQSFDSQAEFITVEDVTSVFLQIFFPDEEQWYDVMHWSARSGSLSYSAGGSFAYGGTINTDDPVWHVTVGLVQRLDAEVRGDEGESYDLTTGNRMRAQAP